MMKAIVVHGYGGPETLKYEDASRAEPKDDEVLIRTMAASVNPVDAAIRSGRFPSDHLPFIPGLDVAGVVEKIGTKVTKFKAEDPVYAYLSFGEQGGYAEFTVADARFCFHLPDRYDDVEVAPLLCAGLIGYRSYRKTADARRLGMYGFGNAAQLIAQIALYEGRDVFVFTRPGDTETQQSAKALGAKWAGGSDEMPPEKLDAAIIFASVGPLVPAALHALAKGGIVVCGGIHMSDIPSFPYADLWEERIITSVANLTRRDGEEFFNIAPRVPVKTKTETFPLEEANIALDRFRAGKLSGTAVLLIPKVGHPDPAT
jgi:propanol-preferring alcohol dehydrogenase